ncbi:TPA: hypothetical protein I8Y22_004053 [Raoultella planticola]|nr:hypothetical protein [Raoultella planticola]
MSKVDNSSDISGGIEGIYPLPFVKNGGLPNTSSHTLDRVASQSTGNEVNGNTKGQR